MRHTLIVLVGCFSVTPFILGDEPVAPNGVPAGDSGGMMFIRSGNQKILTYGGGGEFFPRRVKMTTATPRDRSSLGLRCRETLTVSGPSCGRTPPRAAPRGDP